MRIIPTLVAIAFGITAAHAETAGLTFDGERFEKTFESRGAKEQLAEFTRSGETVHAWRKLVAMHWYVGDARSAADAATALARLARQRDAGANALASENRSTAEALVHFMVQAPGSDTVEVNAFKFARGPEGRGLVAVQFAFRFELGAELPEDVKAARRRAVEEIRSFDMRQVRSSFQPGA